MTRAFVSLAGKGLTIYTVHINDLVSICIQLKNSYWLVYRVCVIPWYIGDSFFFLPGISVAVSVVVVVCILLAIPIMCAVS